MFGLLSIGRKLKIRLFSRNADNWNHRRRMIALIPVWTVLGYTVGYFGGVHWLPPTVVLEDMGVVDGFRRSISVVRHHLVSTLVYSLIGTIIGGLAGVTFAATSIIMSPQSTTMFAIPEPSLPIVVGMGFTVVVGGILFCGFFAVYSVSFYRVITPRAGDMGA